ncbi:MAG: hypothetical protein WC233_07955 [Sphaerochaeta sp.]
MPEPKYSYKADSEIQDLLVDCYRSTSLLARTFFPERFYAPFSGLHDQIFELIDSNAPKIAIAAPRGLGKSSIVGLAYSAKKILYRDSHFLPYISNSATSAEQQTENLKSELKSNLVIKKLFGDIQTKSVDLGDQFSKRSWVARLSENEHGTLILPRGSGQQIRGQLYINYRPDYIIVDDFEDSNDVLNEELRLKQRTWFYADLLKCVSRIKKDWQIVYIDTLKHEDALLQRLLDSPDWVSVRLELCDDDFSSNAPEFISTEDIKKEAEEHRNEGMMDVFYREYRNLPVSKEDATFRSEDFKYYVEGPDEIILRESKGEGVSVPTEKISTREFLNVVIVDPAKTVKVQSADSAIVCWGVGRSTHKLLFRDCVSGKMYPNDIYREAFDMVRRWKAFYLAVEVTSLHQFISQPIQNQMKVEGVFAQYVELSAVGKKEERVKHLSPYYRQGYIYHNPAVSTKLENQLQTFPRSKLWDVMDAAAYIVKLLDELSIYFDPGDFDIEMPEDYSDLTDDKVLDDWKVI